MIFRVERFPTFIRPYRVEDFPKIRGKFLEVPIIRNEEYDYLDLYWGPLIMNMTT